MATLPQVRAPLRNHLSRQAVIRRQLENARPAEHKSGMNIKEI